MSATFVSLWIEIFCFRSVRITMTLSQYQREARQALNLRKVSTAKADPSGRAV